MDNMVHFTMILFIFFFFVGEKVVAEMEENEHKYNIFYTGARIIILTRADKYY